VVVVAGGGGGGGGGVGGGRGWGGGGGGGGSGGRGGRGISKKSMSTKKTEIRWQTASQKGSLGGPRIFSLRRSLGEGKGAVTLH